MPASISVLPIWKKDSSAVEWLQELASMAMEHPERFERAVIVIQEVMDEGTSTKNRRYSRGLEWASQELAVLELAKLEIFEELKGR
jgi:hypothetical protein